MNAALPPLYTHKVAPEFLRTLQGGLLFMARKGVVKGRTNQ